MAEQLLFLAEFLQAFSTRWPSPEERERELTAQIARLREKIEAYKREKKETAADMRRFYERVEALDLVIRCLVQLRDEGRERERERRRANLQTAILVCLAIFSW